MGFTKIIKPMIHEAFFWVLNFVNRFYKIYIFLCFFYSVWEAKEGEIYVLEWSKEELEILDSSLYVQSLPLNIPNWYYIFVYLQSP